MQNNIYSSDTLDSTLGEGLAVESSYPRPRLKRVGTLREIINSLFFIAVALIFSEMAFPRSSIDGPSMEPTLFTGQNLLISRLHYLFGDIQRGDIAVFDPPNAKEEMLIKRVIGIPGDTIEMRNQEVYLNGEKLNEPYFVNAPCMAMHCPDETWTLGPDEYFFMGDNRNRSNDSRAFNQITRDRIVGKALFRYWPPDKFGPIY